MNLTFKKKEARNLFETIWLIRRECNWTNDGLYTIGKIRRNRLGEITLQLNGDMHLKLEEVHKVIAFMNTIEVAS